MNLFSHFFIRSVYFLIIFFLLIISQSQTAAGQSAAKAEQKFNKLDQAYHSDHISPGKYLDSAYALTRQFLDEGTELKTEKLVELLRLYKNIAWSKKDYGRPRVNYYQALADNASMFGETGAAMYYTEKQSKELAANNRIRPLMVDAYKVQPFQEQGLNNQIIALYQKDEAYIKHLPEQLRNKKTDNVNGMYAIDILGAVVESYSKTRDTAALYQASKVADQISTALRGKYPINPGHMLYNDFYMLSRHHSIALFEGNSIKTGSLLDSMQKVIAEYKDQTTVYVELPLCQWKVDYFLALKNVDSARFYIKKLESFPVFFKVQQPMLDEYKAKLQVLQGDFRRGYTSITNALAGERKAKTVLMTQMDNLLYAYTDAENTKIDLQQSEAIKNQRTIWLVIISCSAAIIVLAIYLIMRYRSRKAKSQIAALNDAANMQIIAMEEARHQAVREEQQRLGQDLHDGLASSIASIRHRVETLSLNINDSLLKGELNLVQNDLANAYQVARNKSHEWFIAADEQQQQSFAGRIKLLTDGALPDSRYYKTIHIDDNSIVNIATDTRIALLRIIQEAITNIIKHAKAKNVGILIYEEEDSLILTISDDGVGLDEKKSKDKKTTLGLESIRRRAHYLNGEVNIKSGTKGTEIIVSIPLVP